jgi:4-aminobutyrate aminotransferase-like enzyme
MAVEFESERFNKKVIAECIGSGVIVDWFLFSSSCMRICPPLTISEEEIKRSCEIILMCHSKGFQVAHEII